MKKTILITKENFEKLKKNFRWREVTKEYSYVEIDDNKIELSVNTFYSSSSFDELLNKYNLYNKKIGA